jgi:hypothetical protein
VIDDDIVSQASMWPGATVSESTQPVGEARQAMWSVSTKTPGTNPVIRSIVRELTEA